VSERSEVVSNSLKRPDYWNCIHGNIYGSCFHTQKEFDCDGDPKDCLYYVPKKRRAKTKKYINKAKIRKVEKIISYDWDGKNHNLTALLECGHTVTVIYNKPYGMTLEEMQRTKQCKCKECVST